MPHHLRQTKTCAFFGRLFMAAQQQHAFMRETRYFGTVVKDSVEEVVVILRLGINQKTSFET